MGFTFMSSQKIFLIDIKNKKHKQEKFMDIPKLKEPLTSHYHDRTGSAG